MRSFIDKISGIKIKKNKTSRSQEIIDAGIPEVIKISVVSHIGTPAKIVVKAGDIVKVGTLIATSDGKMSANVYSSVSGKVSEIVDNMVVIKTSGDFFEPSIDNTKDISTSIPEDKAFILEQIRKAGIIGMGGAGFPTSVKLDIPEDKKIECLIINCIECEPYFTSDNRLLIEKSEEIIIGARIVNRLLGIQNAIIAIDESNKEAIKIMTKMTKSYVGVNVKTFKNIYPQGAEKQLIKAISGKELATSKLPMDIGFVVQNVGTIHAIYEAVMKNLPLFKRIVTVSGDAVEKPQNFVVRNGTPASYLIKKVDVDINNVATLILNGQMMGRTIQDLNTPIGLLNGGLLMFKSAKPYTEASACIRCNSCAQNCPVHLQPFAIANTLKLGDTPKLYKLRAFDCIGCGICSYVCPAKIPLLDFVKIAKEETR